MQTYICSIYTYRVMDFGKGQRYEDRFVVCIRLDITAKQNASAASGVFAVSPVPFVLDLPRQAQDTIHSWCQSTMSISGFFFRS
ncbi:hypothetical protein BOTBODRAFT_571636 [Botryobasidium botryosum FD-172 SS1]|uniref:Uncharacterized protein n=1 Tax=Botryobasidium botryosum (strain FD-172 SS1) TaxID=930990 RepID=A0A067LY31_BOTB1|nr:hypothetical protein BOTBODRAFT_571636 [Botryobasidium botryosum FD-172 SS1]